MVWKEKTVRTAERVIEKLIRKLVHIGEILFGFIRGCRTSNTIANLRQLHQKYLAKKEEFALGIYRFRKSF